MRIFRCIAVLILMLFVTNAFARNRRCREVVCECPPTCCSDAASPVKCVTACAAPQPTVAAQDQTVVLAVQESPVESKVAEPISKPAEPQKPATELEQILADWQKAASKIRRLDCEFLRFKYDKTFEIEKRGEGTIAIESPQRARYRIVPTILPPGGVGKKVAKNGIPYELKADRPECWHWTGTQVISFDDDEHSYRAMEISPRSDLGGFGWGLNSFYLARPFLLGMPAEDLKKQFTVTVNTNDSNEVWLNLIPRDSRVAANLTKAILILDRDKWLAKAVKILDPTGAESVHVFKNMRINSPTESANDLSKPKLEGYREVMTEKVRQKDSAK